MDPGSSSVEWFFDVVSPFAYLQLEQLPRWLPPQQLIIRPVVLGALLSHWNTRGPAEIPLKRLQTYRSAMARAQQLGLRLRFPPAHPFNPIPLLRLAVALDARFDAVREIMRFVWRDGGDASSADGWEDSVRHRLACTSAAERISADDVKRSLRQQTDEAIRRGVFGVPTLVVHGEFFWGEDSTEMARHTHAHGPAWLHEGEWRRLANLPAGVQRAA